MIRKELIGVALAIPPGLPPNLNQQLLFVEKLGIVGLDEIADDFDSAVRTWPHRPSHIIRLRDAGVAIPLPKSLSASLLLHAEAGPALEAAAAATERAQALLSEFSGHVPQERVEEFFQKLNESHREANISRSYVARAMAVAARLNTGVDTVSLLPIVDERSGAVSRDEALRITIDALPVPSDRIPPIEVIKFREDPDNRLRLLELRAWANAMARGQYTAAEMRDELAVRLERYAVSLRQLERNYEYRKFTVVFTAIPSVLRQLLGGDVAKAGESLFEIASVRTRLLQEERELPGHELSYIVAADRRFARDKT